MIVYKSSEEIELMKQSSQLVSKTLGMLAPHIQPGITTLELDRLAEEYIRDHKAIPGFLGLYNFPNTLCTSVNDQVVHGIPNKKVLREGDIVSVDCGVLLNDFYGDHAYTFPVGEISPEVAQLLKVTRESLELAIEKFKPGNRIGDLSYVIQQHAESHGYGVVRELVGHGLGRNMHEDPEVPNYGKKGTGKKIQDGLVIAIEPMINMGTRRIRQLKDGWTIVTADGNPSAHFEHNVAILNGEAVQLSTFAFIEQALELQVR